MTQPEEKDTAREVMPVRFFDPGAGPDDMDFTPKVLNEREEDPKDLFAQVRVDSSDSTLAGAQSQTPTASVEKDNTPPKADESGTPPSLQKTRAGKNEPPASEKKTSSSQGEEKPPKQ